MADETTETIETMGAEPTWLKIARGELGTHEIPGPRSNKRILEYHATTTLKATSDEIPWCAAFVCWCLEKAGIDSTRSAAAASYLKFGTKLKNPRLGCIVVFPRKGGHHVGFYLGDHPGNDCKIDVLSGNSADQVRISPYDKDSVLAYVWPA